MSSSQHHLGVESLDLSDAELIETSLRSPSVFGDFMLRHYGLVFAFVARRLGQDRSGEVTSEVFVRAFADRSRFTVHRGTCLLWLYRIAQGLVDDRINADGRKDEPCLHECLQGDGPAPSDELMQRVNGALSGLSKPDRDVLLLHALEGLDEWEIGRVLSMGRRKVGARLARAKTELHRAIPDCAELAAELQAS